MGKYYINDNSKSELTNQLMELISNSTQYIKISSFLMQDKEVINRLMEISSSGQAAVFVISNQNRKESDEYNESGEMKTDNDKPGVNSHEMFLQTLFFAGIHVRLLDNLHAKFLVVDGNDGLLMSANISNNSLRRNVETGISLNSKELSDLELVFDTMYNYADIVRFVNKRNVDIVKKSYKPLPSSILGSLNSDIKLTACSKRQTNLSDCHITSIYDTIISMINSSQKFIYIVSWEFKDYGKGLTLFYKAIEKAIKRKVIVKLYYNEVGSLKNLENQREFIYKMGTMGCDAYSDKTNHSKCLLTESEGFLFTANIDGYNGLTEGFEVGCILNEEQYKKALAHVESLIGNGDKAKK